MTVAASWRHPGQRCCTQTHHSPRAPRTTRRTGHARARPQSSQRIPLSHLLYSVTGAVRRHQDMRRIHRCVPALPASPTKHALGYGRTSLPPPRSAAVALDGRVRHQSPPPWVAVGCAVAVDAG
jgi:hypothetical protein